MTQAYVYVNTQLSGVNIHHMDTGQKSAVRCGYRCSRAQFIHHSWLPRPRRKRGGFEMLLFLPVVQWQSSNSLSHRQNLNVFQPQHLYKGTERTWEHVFTAWSLQLLAWWDLMRVISPCYSQTGCNSFQRCSRSASAETRQPCYSHCSLRFLKSFTLKWDLINWIDVWKSLLVLIMQSRMHPLWLERMEREKSFFLVLFVCVCAVWWVIGYYLQIWWGTLAWKHRLISNKHKSAANGKVISLAGVLS